MKPPEDTVPDMVTIDDISKLLDAKLAGLATVEMVQASEKRLRAEMEDLRNAIPTDSQIVKIVKSEVSAFVEQLKASQAAWMEKALEMINEVKVSAAGMKAAVDGLKENLTKQGEEVAENRGKIDSIELGIAQINTSIALIQHDQQSLRKMIVGNADEPGTQPDSVLGKIQRLTDNTDKRFAGIGTALTEYKHDMKREMGEGFDRLTALNVRQTEAYNAVIARLDKIETEMGKYRKWLTGGLKLAWNFVTSRKGAALVGGLGTLGALIKALIDNLPSVILMAWLAIVLSGCI